MSDYEYHPLKRGSLFADSPFGRSETDQYDKMGDDMMSCYHEHKAGPTSFASVCMDTE